jgi:hypothetical protein
MKEENTKLKKILLSKQPLMNNCTNKPRNKTTNKDNRKGKVSFKTIQSN